MIEIIFSIVAILFFGLIFWVIRKLREPKKAKSVIGDKSGLVIITRGGKSRRIDTSYERDHFTDYSSSSDDTNDYHSRSNYTRDYYSTFGDNVTDHSSRSSDTSDYGSTSSYDGGGGSSSGGGAGGDF